MNENIFRIITVFLPPDDAKKPRNITDIAELLAGDDLRSPGKSSEIISLINDQNSFDKLIESKNCRA